MMALQSKHNKPYYAGDRQLTEMIRSLLDNKEKILTDVDLFESDSEKKSFQKLVDDFEDYYRKLHEQKNGTVTARKPVKGKKELITRLFCMMRDKIALVEKDLAVAEDIQRNLLPDRVPKIEGYDLAAYYHPSRQIGGDYYDFFPIGDNRLYFIIADVAGHGIPSSLVVSSMQAFIWSQIQEEKNLYSIVENLNKYLVKTMIGGKFVTLFLGGLQIKSGTLTYINAGHNPPYIIRESGKVEALGAGGPVVGMIDDASYISGYAVLDEGDILACYTDGIVESMNKNDTMFSERRFLKIIRTERKQHLIRIMLRLFNDLQRFCDGIPYGDDVTLLFMRKRTKRL
ncbi:PP2C family protein-serine/threonine phosphatase [candidate division KSB1 bacterium]